MTDPQDKLEYVEETGRFPAAAFVTDPRVQRPEDPTWVAELIRLFDPHQVGVITASLRADKKMVVLDGQHRLLAAKGSGNSNLMVTCRLIHGVQEDKRVRTLTLEEEAALFITLNHSKRVSAAAQFNAGQTMKDPTALDIMKMLRKHGWEKVGTWRSPRVFTVINVALRIYNGTKNSLNTRASDGRDALWNSLETFALAGELSSAWGPASGVTPGPLLAGVAHAFLKDFERQRVLERNGTPASAIPLMKTERLARALAKETPAVLLARAKLIAGAMNRSLKDAVAQLATDADASECKGRTPRPEWHS